MRLYLKIAKNFIGLIFLNKFWLVHYHFPPYEFLSPVLPGGISLESKW